MKVLKKIRRFLGSMPLAITLLVLLAAACALCSAVPQGQTPSWYREQYGERTGSLILALYVDDAYHSGWFIALSGFLCLSLIMCNLSRIGQLIRRTRQMKDPATILKQEPDVEQTNISEPRPLFAKMRMSDPKSCKTEDGREAIASGRNTAGMWGAWICHLGILLLIIGFALGQMMSEQYTAYGLPGETCPIGDTGYSVTVDDFRIDWREDGTADQYTADLTMTDAGGNSASGTASVNHPASLFGYDFIQNSTGWGAYLRILRNGEEVQRNAMYVQDFVPLEEKPKLLIRLVSFSPNYDAETGTSHAMNSVRPEHPAYFYEIYYDRELYKSGVQLEGEAIELGPYTFIFENPTNYTVLMVKKERFTTLIIIGSLITVLGLILALYLHPETMWAIRNEEGDWTVYGKNPKGGTIYREKFTELISSGEERG